MRIAFTREMELLQERTLSLGSQVSSNLRLSVDVLLRGDKSGARQLVAIDEDVNAKRINIGMDCLSLIARQQPVASDMRQLAALLEIVGELERIHDYVKGIAKITLMLADSGLPEAYRRTLPIMAEKASHMLNEAMRAFAEVNGDLARAIPHEDDEIDEMFNHLYTVIINYVRAYPTEVDRANKLEWALHNLERSADRVINICEWILYMVTGVYTELDSEYEAPPEVID